MPKKMKREQKPRTIKALARSIARDILTVYGEKGEIVCTRAQLMKGKYPAGEKNMGGRNAASIAWVIEYNLRNAGLRREHLRTS